MLEENKTVELNEEELSNVFGGYNIGDKEARYCKYCEKNTTQTFDRVGSGYSGYRLYGCFIWRCDECNNDNYYDAITGNLI